MADLMTLQRATRTTEPHSSPRAASLERDHSVVLAEVLERGIVHLAGRLSLFDGLSLPEKPNTCTFHSGVLAAWIGLHRWLLIGSAADAARWLGTNDPNAAVADLSHGRRVIRIAGPGWRELLSRGCPLDVATIFRAGQWNCAQSLFSEVPVFICAPPDLSFVELSVPSSYGACFWDMLKLMAQPQGCRIGNDLHG